MPNPVSRKPKNWALEYLAGRVTPDQMEWLTQNPEALASPDPFGPGSKYQPLYTPKEKD